ncbi:Myb 1-like protein [Giardia duodenalis ATCC 50581]|uniref:Myb 1-like protein n=2 Tax=Giardia intestinalis TaxID=5741 RepID=C6M031_GIAIB|nr:Myb 1-like protein [Giardia intestinalis ATCC 50581]
MSLEEVKWCKEDDAILERAVNMYGVHKWGAISSLLVGRSPQECRERWTRVLQYKKGAGVVEDSTLLKLYHLFGDAWDVISGATSLSPAACKSRVYHLLGLESSSDEPSADPLTHPIGDSTVDTRLLRNPTVVVSTPLHNQNVTQGKRAYTISHKELAHARQKEYTDYMKHKPKKQALRGSRCSHLKRTSSATTVTTQIADYWQYIRDYICRNRIRIDPPSHPNKDLLELPKEDTGLVNNPRKHYHSPLSLYPIYVNTARGKLFTAVQFEN